MYSKKNYNFKNQFHKNTVCAKAFVVKLKITKKKKNNKD